MTEDDDARHLRDELDAAIGPTPPAPDRMEALTSRYAAWHRRRAIAAGAGGAAAVAVMVVVGLTVAIGPGSSHDNNQVAISPTVAPTAVGTTPSTPGLATTPPPSTGFASATAGLPTVGPTAPPAQKPTSGESATTGQPTAPPTRLLQGVVVNEAGAPLPGIFVTGLDGVTQTDANGHFVAPTKDGHHGGCLLFSSQSISQPQSGPPAGGDYAWQEWESANCGDDAVANLRITMQPGADVFGTVRNPAGASVAGVPVYVTLGANDAWFLTSSCCGVTFAATTDAQGNYRIYGLRVSSVKVAVRQPAGLDGAGGIAVSATPGDGQPTNLVDYGEGCDDVFPNASCPNAPSPSPSG